MEAEFVQDVLQVAGGGALRNGQRLGNLAVAQAACDKLGNLGLAWSKAWTCVSRRGGLGCRGEELDGRVAGAVQRPDRSTSCPSLALLKPTGRQPFVELLPLDRAQGRHEAAADTGRGVHELPRGRVPHARREHRDPLQALSQAMGIAEVSSKPNALD